MTSEQALGDFVLLLNTIKKQLDLIDADIIAFGGSYGGMLSSWIRMKFPNLIKGAVASSAPILLFEKPSNKFFSIVTETYRRYEGGNKPGCVTLIREGFRELEQLINSFETLTSSELNEISNLFNTCKTISRKKELIALSQNIEDLIVSQAQLNYPYAYGGLPDLPAEKMCLSVQNHQENFLSSYASLSYLTEVTKKFSGKCFDNTPSDEIDPANQNGWYFMACSEMIMTYEKDGITDMFSPLKFDLKTYSETCKTLWNSEIKDTWIYDFYGGRNIKKEMKNYSNLFFFNGTMDPWYSGCVLDSDLDEGAAQRNIQVVDADSAHHLDLHLPNNMDPYTVTRGREKVVDAILNWLDNSLCLSKLG